MQLDIRIAEPLWRDRVPHAGALCRRAVRAAVAETAAAATAREFTLLLTDDTEMQRLNRHWRGMRKPTDVLSFEIPGQSGDCAYGGDLALGLAAVERGARDWNRALSDHLAHLVVHGVLHLLGHDHQNGGDARRMRAAETRALARIGISDPHTSQPAEAKLQ